MAFRNTTGIVTDGPNADPALDADMIIGAMIVGFAIQKLQDHQNVQFDIAPREEGEPEEKWQRGLDQLTRVAKKVGNVASTYLHGTNNTVSAGVAVEHQQGAVVMGIYGLTGQTAPTEADIQDPTDTLSEKGRGLFNTIKKLDEKAGYQYIGRGAYTGFVDNNNAQVDTNPVGPMSTVRAAIPDLVADDREGNSAIAGWHPRWLPHSTSSAWARRERRNQAGNFVPWGLIGGDFAGNPIDTTLPNPTNVDNLADQITDVMEIEHGMPFLNDGGPGTISGYTHGMVQALYKAYHLGPSCHPYEITAGRDTTKLASCFGCSVFMTATGYIPSATHLGSAESWAPFYGALSDPEGLYEHELDPNVLRDLNARFAEYCDQALRLGLAALPAAALDARYHAARNGLAQMLGRAFQRHNHVASTLFLDALTVHDKEVNRISRLLGV